MQKTKDIAIGVAIIVGLFIGVGLVVKIVEEVGTEISRRLDPYMETLAERMRDWTRPLWEERRSPEKDIRDLNKYLEELNRLTDEHQRRIRGQ